MFCLSFILRDGQKNEFSKSDPCGLTFNGSRAGFQNYLNIFEKKIIGVGIEI
jgi:hypothetical protein